MKYVLIAVLLLGAVAAHHHSFHAGVALLVTVAVVIALKDVAKSINAGK